MPKNSRLEEHFSDTARWGFAAAKLRCVLRDCGLTEEVKWRQPCYTHEGKNICIIQSFNDFLALLFFKGALLKDPDRILEAQGPNSRVGFRTRFYSVDDVEKRSGSIRSYVREAIAIELAGLKVEPREPKELEYPEELIAAFALDPGLEEAFERLTPGRQRGYVWHFTEAKQSKTRAARIQRYRDRIFDGKGMSDR